MWDYLGGRECEQTCRKAKWTVSAELKQLKIAKGKVELKKKKADGICVVGDFTSRKTGRMHREKASEIDSLPWSQNNRKKTSCLWYSVKCQTRGALEINCAQRHTTTCMSRHTVDFR